jgi:hypothetical protein
MSRKTQDLVSLLTIGVIFATLFWWFASLVYNKHPLALITPESWDLSGENRLFQEACNRDYLEEMGMYASSCADSLGVSWQERWGDRD